MSLFTTAVAATAATPRTRHTPDAALRPEAVAVRDALAARGLETPMAGAVPGGDEQRQGIEAHFTEIMKLLGLDLRDDSLIDTPRRVAKMYVTRCSAGSTIEIFRGSRSSRRRWRTTK
jgi:hypothetical protein